ncbi:MAG: hypothetical protein QMC96_13185 [Methanomicrobiales archaeon]|nr:hypothetical protein [Methanomicrobiales archaeon]
MGRIDSVSLVLIASIFLLPLVSTILTLPRSLAYIAPAVAILALFGLGYYLRESQRRSTHWYFGLPLVFVMGVFALSFLIYGTSNLFNPLSISALLLLAPASAAFFYSFAAIRTQMARDFILLLSVLSIYPVCILFCMLLSPYPFRNELVLFAFLMYYLLEMPFIGLMYIIAAWKMNSSGQHITGGLYILQLFPDPCCSAGVLSYTRDNHILSSMNSKKRLMP